MSCTQRPQRRGSVTPSTCRTADLPLALWPCAHARSSFSAVGDSYRSKPPSREGSVARLRYGTTDEALPP